MNLVVDININLNLPGVLPILTQLKELIMTTQAELTQGLTDLTAQVVKIGTETTTLVQKVADLETVLASQQDVSPELQAAFDALKAQVTVVDGLVPDAA